LADLFLGFLPEIFLLSVVYSLSFAGFLLSDKKREVVMTFPLSQMLMRLMNTTKEDKQASVSVRKLMFEKVRYSPPKY